MPSGIRYGFKPEVANEYKNSTIPEKLQIGVHSPETLRKPEVMKTEDSHNETCTDARSQDLQERHVIQKKLTSLSNRLPPLSPTNIVSSIPISTISMDEVTKSISEDLSKQQDEETAVEDKVVEREEREEKTLGSMKSSLSTRQPLPVAVAVRCRPLLSSEKNSPFASGSCLSVHPEDPSTVEDESAAERSVTSSVVRIGLEDKVHRQFAFDLTFDEEKPQSCVYQESIAPLIPSFFAGYNATVFAYGQTGSGKTYTMGMMPEQVEVKDSRRKFGTDTDPNASNQNGQYLDESAGIIPRVVRDVFRGLLSKQKREQERIERTTAVEGEEQEDKKSHQDSFPSSTYSSHITVSFMEIYNGCAYDLLCKSIGSVDDNSNGSVPPPPLPTAAHHHRRKLRRASRKALPHRHPSTSSIRVQDGPNGKVYISGLTHEPVACYAEVMEKLSEGCKRRSSASTLMNDRSSRSHAILTLTLEQRWETRESAVEEKEMVNSKGRRRSRRRANHSPSREKGSRVRMVQSKFHLVDLAGSERNKRTGNEGLRLLESVAINQGLLALGNVIRALSLKEKKRERDQQRRDRYSFSPQRFGEGRGSSGGRYIPYRSSLLTRVLQDSLGGSALTVMIACLSPCNESFGESMNVLRWAARARDIKNTPVKNEVVVKKVEKVNKEEDAALQVEKSQSRAAASASVSTGNSASTGADFDPLVVSERISSLTQLSRHWRLRAALYGLKCFGFSRDLRIAREDLLHDEEIFALKLRELAEVKKENESLKVANKRLAEHVLRRKEEDERNEKLLEQAEGNAHSESPAGVALSPSALALLPSSSSNFPTNPLRDSMDETATQPSECADDHVGDEIRAESNYIDTKTKQEHPQESSREPSSINQHPEVGSDVVDIEESEINFSTFKMFDDEGDEDGVIRTLDGSVIHEDGDGLTDGGLTDLHMMIGEDEISAAFNLYDESIVQIQSEYEKIREKERQKEREEEERRQQHQAEEEKARVRAEARAEAEEEVRELVEMERSLESARRDQIEGELRSQLRELSILIKHKQEFIRKLVQEENESRSTACAYQQRVQELHTEFEIKENNAQSKIARLEDEVKTLQKDRKVLQNQLQEEKERSREREEEEKAPEVSSSAEEKTKSHHRTSSLRRALELRASLGKLALGHEEMRKSMSRFAEVQRSTERLQAKLTLTGKIDPSTGLKIPKESGDINDQDKKAGGHVEDDDEAAQIDDALADLQTEGSYLKSQVEIRRSQLKEPLQNVLHQVDNLPEKEARLLLRQCCLQLTALKVQRKEENNQTAERERELGEQVLLLRNREAEMERALAQATAEFQRRVHALEQKVANEEQSRAKVTPRLGGGEGNQVDENDSSVDNGTFHNMELKSANRVLKQKLFQEKIDREVAEAQASLLRENLLKVSQGQKMEVVRISRNQLKEIASPSPNRRRRRQQQHLH